MIGIFLPPMSLDVSKIKYSLKLIAAFDKVDYSEGAIVFVHKKHIGLLKSHITHIQLRSYGYSLSLKFIKKICTFLRLDIIEPDFQKSINKYGITYCIFPTPTKDILHCKIPYAAAFQSLGHRLNPELQDTAGDGLWKAREDVYSVVAKNASLIFIDSEVGKKYLEFYYQPKGYIIVIPHDMPAELKIEVDEEKQKEILNRFKVSGKYLFYPAQFWPHKNHIRILEAIKLLKYKGINVQIVFTGSSKSIRKQYDIEYRLKRIAKESNIENYLNITGYLTAEEIYTFYINATAMIMPQLIPEPCIPFIESMGLGCPIIGSDIPGIREQIDGCGVLVNPYNVESIADGIALLYNNNSIRNEFIRKGLEKRENIEQKKHLIFLEIENEIRSITHLCQK